METSVSPYIDSYFMMGYVVQEKKALLCLGSSRTQEGGY